MALAAAIGAYIDFRRFADTPLVTSASSETLEISLGSSFIAIVKSIQAQQLSKAPWWYWRLLMWQETSSGGSILHAGEYALSSDLTPRELLRHMLVGEVLQRKFTIVEGVTFHQLRLILANETRLQATLQGMSDAEIMQKLGAKDDNSEGRFLPETYAYVKGQTDFDLIRRAYLAMQQTLEQAWSKRDPGVSLATPYQTLILASIIERETARPEERAQIAQVFLRRLALGMRLQTDPSVIYGLGAQFNGNLTRHDLEFDTPFNTYTRAGLPPTPICLPSKAAIEAALHPAPGNALYFVARGDGTHEFSDTLEAHNQAVAKYQLHKTR